MAFVDRINLPDFEVPVRAYIHEAGFEEVYGGDVEVARKRLEDVIRLSDWKEREKQMNLQYILTTLIGGEEKYQGKPIVGFFGFFDIENWPGESKVKIFCYLKPDQREVILNVRGDTLIMLGEEEKYRRTTKSLDEYMRNPPEISVMRALEKS